MFDSPIDWCRVCKDWVALDQTPAECARGHNCADRQCPLAALLWMPGRRQKDEVVLKRGVPQR
jgi:hypothetical protein